MTIKVSVIVPIYNGEAYLSECVESLLSQTLKECEFIFVNDGSTDRSAEIVERYRETDSRITVIYQPNQGVSVARNKGIQAAMGQYIGFVDADDYIDADMFELLYDGACCGNCDVVFSNFISEMDGHEVITQYDIPSDVVLSSSFIRQEVLPALLRTDEWNTVWNKIYRLQILRKNDLKFPEKVALGEDGMFNMLFFSHIQTLKYINYSGYHYREVSGSATRSMGRKDYFSRALEVYESELPECYMDLIDGFKVNQFKSIKLIHSVIANIHIYLKPSSEMGIIAQIRYVRRMIGHQQVQLALPIYYREMGISLDRYKKLIVRQIERKSILGLYFLTAYSRFRNAKNGG
ncbi:glycosyltransferase involved in cell wall biosynthesis [Paenibacillus castaneae]|uniref:glycosyltransferase n=1 Tax=Paenibacillus castaneae TaxID=474957 RepID=UPI000C9CA33D|nr:glycosyltransferase [Paenibacillus castaneae]NIK76096.1 glycosyltransferase involved in cell wall biosynthesis [Paenibacillus castaneae]